MENKIENYIDEFLLFFLIIGLFEFEYNSFDFITILNIVRYILQWLLFTHKEYIFQDDNFIWKNISKKNFQIKSI